MLMFPLLILQGIQSSIEDFIVFKGLECKKCKRQVHTECAVRMGELCFGINTRTGQFVTLTYSIPFHHVIIVRNITFCVLNVIVYYEGEEAPCHECVCGRHDWSIFGNMLLGINSFMEAMRDQQRHATPGTRVMELSKGRELGVVLEMFERVFEGATTGTCDRSPTSSSQLAMHWWWTQATWTSTSGSPTSTRPCCIPVQVTLHQLMSNAWFLIWNMWQTRLGSACWWLLEICWSEIWFDFEIHAAEPELEVEWGIESVVGGEGAEGGEFDQGVRAEEVS